MANYNPEPRVEEIPQQLVQLHATLVDKLGAQPYIEPTLMCYQSGQWQIRIYNTGNSEGPLCLHTVFRPDPWLAIAEAMQFVLSMDEAETRERREWLTSVLRTVDRGRELGIPEEFIAPLYQATEEIRQNLLPAPAPVWQDLDDEIPF